MECQSTSSNNSANENWNEYSLPGNKTIFFKNIPVDWKQKPLQKYFKKLTGECTMPKIYKAHGQSLGMGTVEFRDPSRVRNVLQNDIHYINGCEIRVCQHQTKEERDANRDAFDIFVSRVPLFVTKDKLEHLLQEHFEIKEIELRTENKVKHAFIKCNKKTSGKCKLPDPGTVYGLQVFASDGHLYEITIQKYMRPLAMRKKAPAAGVAA